MFMKISKLFYHAVAFGSYNSIFLFLFAKVCWANSTIVNCASCTCTGEEASYQVYSIINTVLVMVFIFLLLL